MHALPVLEGEVALILNSLSSLLKDVLNELMQGLLFLLRQVDVALHHLDDGAITQSENFLTLKCSGVYSNVKSFVLKRL